MKQLHWTILFLSFVIVTSCVPPGEEQDASLIIDYSNEEQQAVINAIDRRDTAALRSYLNSEDSNIRYLAAQGASSVQSPVLNVRLIEILKNDPVDDIRFLAAYALGQSRDEDILGEMINSFGEQGESNYNSPVRGTILEAIGKLGDEATLRLIAQTSTYRNTDNHLLLGQARAIYRYGLRNIYDDSGTSVMVDRVLDTSIPDATRVIAANYLNRNPDLDISDFLSRLTNQMVSETSLEVQMALAGAITSRGDQSKADLLLSFLDSDIDYRVKSNILRGLSSYNYPIYRDNVLALLDSGNDHIFNLATQLLNGNVPRREFQYFVDKARSTSQKARQAQLLGIALNALTSNYINTRRNISNELIRGLDASSAPGDQIAHLRALSLDPINLQVLNERGLKSPDVTIRTATVNSIPNLITNTRSQRIYRSPSSMVIFKNSIAEHLSEALEEGDPGTTAAIATLLRNESLGFKEIEGLNLSLRSAMRKLKLPQDYEARSECLQTLGFLEDTTYTVPSLDYNYPINWEVLSDLTDSSRAYIITTKGQIELALYKKHAPGSVANFIHLAQDNYYDGKTIHRVVPNFVIQGGCSRGDGYGGLDYSIRSELGPQYYDDEGYLGMASAGKDTEGTV